MALNRLISNICRVTTVALFCTIKENKFIGNDSDKERFTKEFNGDANGGVQHRQKRDYDLAEYSKKYQKT